MDSRRKFDWPALVARANVPQPRIFVPVPNGPTLTAVAVAAALALAVPVAVFVWVVL